MSGYAALPLEDPAANITRIHATTRWPFAALGGFFGAAAFGTGIWAGKTLASGNPNNPGYYQLALAILSAVGSAAFAAGWKMLAPRTVGIDLTDAEVRLAAQKADMVAMKTEVFTAALAEIQAQLQALQAEEAPDGGAGAVGQRFEEMEGYDQWNAITHILGELQAARRCIAEEEPQDQTASLAEVLQEAVRLLTLQNRQSAGTTLVPACTNAFEAKELGTPELNQLWLELGNQIARAAAINRGVRADSASAIRKAEESAAGLRSQLEALREEKRALESQFAATSKAKDGELAVLREQIRKVQEKLEAAESKIRGFAAVITECQAALLPLCRTLIELCGETTQLAELTFSAVAEEISEPFGEFADTLRRLKWAIATVQGKWEGRIAFDELERKYLTPIHAHLERIADTAKRSLRDDTQIFSHSIGGTSPHAQTGDVWGKLDLAISRVGQYLVNASRRVLEDSIEVSSEDEGDSDVSTPKKQARELRRAMHGGAGRPPETPRVVVPMRDLNTLSGSGSDSNSDDEDGPEG